MNIYLDNNATTEVDPRVAEQVFKELAVPPSNPSSVHALGRAARQRLMAAREEIADYFRFRKEEVLFTSGGTEALNLAIWGIDAKQILSSAIEHAAVYETLQEKARRGSALTLLHPDSSGSIAPEQVEQAITEKTDLLVFSGANSETGVKTDLEAIGQIALLRGIPLLVDGVALLGKEPFVIPEGVSAIAFSGHKLHAPKGTGLLLARSSLKLSPLLFGGGQEYGKRSGTENLPGIVGLTRAVALLKEELPSATARMEMLRNRFETRLQSGLSAVHVNGGGARLVNTSNLSFIGADGETLLIQLDRAGIAASHGSACSSGALEPSRVLTQMGLPLERTRTAIRFSLSRYTTEAEIDAAVDILLTLVPRLRSIA